MTPVFFCSPVNDSRWFPYLFRTLCEVLFERAPSVSHMISVCPFVYLSLALSPDWPTDRSIISVHFLSSARSLRLFNQLFSVRVSFACSFLFLYSLSFSLAQKLSIGQQEICVRHDRILRLSVILLRFAFFLGYFVSHSSRISHTTGPDCPISGFSSSFVCNSFTCSTIALFRARPPLQLRSLCRRGTANVDLFSVSCLTRPFSDAG